MSQSSSPIINLNPTLAKMTSGCVTRPNRGSASRHWTIASHSRLYHFPNIGCPSNWSDFVPLNDEPLITFVTLIVYTADVLVIHIVYTTITPTPISTRHSVTRDGRVAKLYPRHIGPFKVIKAFPKTSIYKLELLPAVDFESIHNVFHTNLLRPYIPNDPELFPAREPPRPPPVIPEEDQYEVERIVDYWVLR
jgi:hypothetical protein